jgi:hypothetical protein
MKSSRFYEITICSPLEANRRFGGTCRLHLQCRRISKARNQSEAHNKQSSARTCSPETSRLTFNGLHGFISQKIELFMRMDNHVSLLRLYFMQGRYKKYIYITRKFIQLLRPHGVGYHKFKFSDKTLVRNGQYIISRKFAVKMQDV